MLTTETETYTFHEAANLFPMLPDRELETLANDIKQTGLLNPIILHQGQIIDGRNRYLACKQARVEPRFVVWEPNNRSPLEWVLSQNIHRRHLSASQRACLAVEIKPQFEAAAKQNQLSGLKQGHESRPRSVKVDKTGTPVEVRKEVARRCSVSEGYVYAAQKIRNADESLFQRIKSGTTTITDAKVELKNKELNDWKQRERERWRKERELVEKLDTEDVELDEEMVAFFKKQGEDMEAAFARRRAQMAHEAETKEEQLKNFLRLLEVAERIVDHGYKQEAKTAHPDKEGGSHEAMQDVNEAKAWLLDIIIDHTEKAAAQL
jgi:hypothetical protein